MSVDTAWLKRASAKHQVIDHDRPCAHCAYNLRGLRPIGNCPECGAPIDPTLQSGTQRTPRVSQRPHVPYLRLPPSELIRMARATTCMWLGALGMMIALALAWWTLFVARMPWSLADSVTFDHFESYYLYIGLPGGLAWWAGCLHLAFPRTTLRFFDPNTHQPAAEDLAPPRTALVVQIAAILQFAMPLAMTLCMLSARAGGFYGLKGATETGWPFIVLAGITGVCAAAAAVPLMFTIRNLSAWVGDDESFYRSIATAYGLILGAAWIAITPAFHRELGGGGGLIGMGWTAMIFAVAFYIPWCWIMALHTLSLACRWAIRNQATAGDRESRFIARSLEIQRQAEEERAKWGGHLPH
ncbi:hypothetical protein BH11PLA1_BH11PLA1_02520 [soil metagenome]